MACNTFWAAGALWADLPFSTRWRRPRDAVPPLFDNGARRLLLNTARARIIRAQFSVNTIGFIYLLYSGWRAWYIRCALAPLRSLFCQREPPESISVSQNIPSVGRLDAIARKAQILVLRPRVVITFLGECTRQCIPTQLTKSSCRQDTFRY